MFLQKQALTEGDLLDLIAAGRLKILLTQAEERLNMRFLSECAERSVSVRGQFDSFESFVIHLVLPDSMEVVSVDQRKSCAI
jgi:hypothetical protein